MNRLVLPAAATLALALSATAAHGREVRESSRSNAVEFKIGAYMPRIDSQFQASSAGVEGGLPYKRIFKNDDPFMMMLGVDQHIVRELGTLSLGFAAGWWSVEGKGVSAGGEGSDTTTLQMIPMQFQATYRLDLWEEIVPLVPVLRGGLDYVYWSIKDGGDEVTTFPTGAEASGGTWGWHVTVGLHFLLDYLDPSMAADFDRDAGVNGSYLVLEYQMATIDDFGGGDSFRLGDDTFFIGLALDL
ncbi:MAG: hypothetical protein KC613_00495 [Myxococcales bacterium]|nr:hypothetical protein [Myxococcales bacterium]MCB9526222.1 hypothetical protein [Myxococcales bacterium]